MTIFMIPLRQELVELPERGVRPVLHEVIHVLRAPDRVQDDVRAKRDAELLGQRDHHPLDVAVGIHGYRRWSRLACEL